MTNFAFAAAAYRRMATRGGIEDASPHRLIQMLLDGALARIRSARGFMQRGEKARKGEAVSQALAIVDELSGSLDHDVGGGIAANLSALYAYIDRRLVHANLADDHAALDEAVTLLEQIRDAWNAITPPPDNSVPMAAGVR